MNNNSCNEYEITLSGESLKRYTLINLRNKNEYFQYPDTKNGLKFMYLLTRMKLSMSAQLIDQCLQD